jgi:hypothetical protein
MQFYRILLAAGAGANDVAANTAEGRRLRIGWRTCARSSSAPTRGSASDAPCGRREAAMPEDPNDDFDPDSEIDEGTKTYCGRRWNAKWLGCRGRAKWTPKAVGGAHSWQPSSVQRAVRWPS